MSRTKELVKIAVETSIQAMERSYQESQLYPKKSARFRNIGNFTNTHIFHKIGLHVTTLERAKNNIIPMIYWSCSGSFWSFLNKPKEWDKTYESLADDYSKATFDWFIKYRTAVALAQINIANKLYPFEPLKKISKYSQIKKHILNNNFTINNIKIKGIEIECLVDTFDYNQYSYNDIVKVLSGDTVIDAGAYRGDTALYFAPKLGNEGIVYAFEPDAENCAYLEANAHLNNLTNIKIVKAGVGYCSTTAEQVGIGSGINLMVNDSFGKEKKGVKVYAIDDFMEENKIININFIKMDIEGWELDALKGAENCLKNCKPKLAVCVYHRPEDLFNIVNYLKKIVPEYKLYLDHKSNSWNETILYATM